MMAAGRIPAVAVSALLWLSCTAEKAGNSLIFASTADATTLDPHNTTDSQSDQVIWMVYNALIRYDEDMRFVPDLATRWSVAEDDVTWTFELREGVRFHDGTAFDAQAVKANFDRVLDPEQGHNRRDLFAPIERVEVADDFTVRIVTRYPFGAFEPMMAHVSAAIVNPTVARARGKSFGYSAEATSGTGPYKVVRWRKDLELVLERNEDYFGENGKLETIVYRPITEAASRVIALESGDVDVITHVPPPDLRRLEENPDIAIIKTLSIGAQQFRFHCKREPFRDPRIRQAISHAIDRRAIIDNLMAGMVAPSTGPLTPRIRGRAELGEIPHDPEKAKALLAEAGLPDGFRTKITTTPRYNMGVEIAQAVAAQLAKVGIESEIEVLEWGTIRQYWGGLLPEDCPLEIFIMGAGASSADADWGLRPIFATQERNENNYGYYSNAEFDEVIHEAMRTVDPSERNALYRRAQEIVYLEDPGAVWLFDNYHVVAARSNVAELTTSPLGLVTFERASISSE
ncbi:MAG TPA: ABC transporter substrate-binding protein [Vicinamibacteria bacterium]|nr:ABC transporter substrate-binding protein [Vicinamibacteria bacterium]